jgi:transcription termination factor NusB
VALGAVIKGETDHYDHIARESARGIMQASLATGVPIAFGVLTVTKQAHAVARSKPGRPNKGREAAAAAIDAAASHPETHGHADLSPEKTIVGQRSKARVCAMQMLYQAEWSGEAPARVIEDFWTMRNGTPAIRSMAERLSPAAERERDGIRRGHHQRDDELGTRAPGRDRAETSCASGLRTQDAKMPTAVRRSIIDEAIEISKRYGEPTRRPS